jgi:uncharacterized UBP type Zn finger protein
MRERARQGDAREEGSVGAGGRLSNEDLRAMLASQAEEQGCQHLDAVRDVQPASDVCDACVQLGDEWPELRACMTCGHVGCCEDAKNQHALRHHQATGHPLIRPHLQPEPGWVWCYVDKVMLAP